MTTKNLILRTDSYKVSHWPVYPEGTDFIYSYLESRGGLFPETVMAGTHFYLKRYLDVRITAEMVEYARKRFVAHFGDDTIFNYDGWMSIVTDLNGKLPLRIRAVPEGTVVPTRNVLMTIENTVKGYGWLVNHFETLMLKVWYPITVATLSREIKKIIAAALHRTGDINLLPFKLHDFGYRGVSSEESAEVGGMAHLINFMGTDTFIALEMIDEIYGEQMAGFSIPATEHSVMTARGEMGEVEQMKRFLETFEDATVPAIACVSDSFNIFRACEEYWGGALRAKVLKIAESGKVLVVRPDSGEPAVVVRQVIETLDKQFGHSINDKGFKVLNGVRVIQGDGITLDSIKRIIDELEIRGWSIDNIAFGMGGALLQQVNRDTLKFAFKASSMIVNGQVRDIYKDPITDTGKRSKRGRLKLINLDGVLTTVGTDQYGFDILETVYENGEILVNPTFADIRTRAALPSNS